MCDLCARRLGNGVYCYPAQEGRMKAGHRDSKYIPVVIQECEILIAYGTTGQDLKPGFNFGFLSGLRSLLNKVSESRFEMQFGRDLRRIGQSVSTPGRDRHK